MPQSYSEKWWTKEQHAFWYQFFVPFERMVRERPGSHGKRLKYVTAQTVQNRLDDMLGPHNWWDEYEVHGTTVVCRLSIRTPWGDVVTKTDCGDSVMASGEENEKGGFSDALKRAAVKFGIGRHLYEDGLPGIYEDGEPEGVVQRENSPLDRVIDQVAGSAPPPRREATVATPQRVASAFSSTPLVGSQVPAWFRSIGDHYGKDVLAVVRKKAAEEKLDPDMTKWDAALINKMVLRVIAWCKKQPHYNGEFEALETRMIAGKQNTTWAMAVQYFTYKWPNAQPVVDKDHRIFELIGKVTHGEISDPFTCNDVTALQVLTSMFRDGVSGADILPTGD